MRYMDAKYWEQIRIAVDIRRLLGYFSKYRIKCSVFFWFLFSPSLIRYNEKSPISKKIKALCHFWGRNNNTRNKILQGGETTQGRTGKWAKRLRGERESGRNDPGAKRLGAKGKVGETTRGRTGKWAKRPGFIGHIKHSQAWFSKVS